MGNRNDVPQNPFSIGTVISTLHHGQEQFGRIVLFDRVWHRTSRSEELSYFQFEHEIVVLLIERVDVVQDDGDDDVDAIGFMINDGILIISTWTLTVFGQSIQRLIDQFDIVFVDIIA